MMAFVTGANGFIGANVAKALLDRGDEVVSVCHDLHPVTTAKLLGVEDKITWVNGDVQDETLMKRIMGDYSVKTVYHFAALPIVKMGAATCRPIFEVNFGGTLSICEAIREQNANGGDVGLFYVATDKVYGPVNWGRKYLEDDPLNANAPYETSKACADLTVRMYHSMKWISRLAVVRPSNEYGPGDLNSRIIPNSIRCCLRGESPVIFDGMTYVREFTYVKDLASATLLIGDNLDKANGEAFNVGSGELRNQEQTIAEILRHFPNSRSVFAKPPAWSRQEIPYQLLDSSKVHERFGWNPLWNFEDGIRDTVEWWKAQ